MAQLESVVVNSEEPVSGSVREYIQSKLDEGKLAGNYRSLKISDGLVDFYSNDYLGFAGDKILIEDINEAIGKYKGNTLGSTGSRLLSGNNQTFEELEDFLASYHRSEAALVFNSGFDANYGLLSTLPYRGDTIIFDEGVHASLHDGVRASKANSVSFTHNNIDDLENKLLSASGLKYVVVESVYSMNGSLAPLNEIVQLCDKYNASLIVDEAHATGVFGPEGRGRICELRLEEKCLARVHTFGKALGVHGAVVLCSSELKEFLVNYCRPFIYSTALPLYSVLAIRCAYNLLEKSDERREALFSKVRRFRELFSLSDKYLLEGNIGPVQSLIASGNEKTRVLAEQIQAEGFDVRPILYPTVPKGSELVRICLHSFNSDEEIDSLARAINSL